MPLTAELLVFLSWLLELEEALSMGYRLLKLGLFSSMSRELTALTLAHSTCHFMLFLSSWWFLLLMGSSVGLC